MITPDDIERSRRAIGNSASLHAVLRTVRNSLDHLKIQQEGDTPTLVDFLAGLVGNVLAKPGSPVTMLPVKVRGPGDVVVGKVEMVGTPAGPWSQVDGP